MEEMGEGAEMVRMPCDHGFHEKSMGGDGRATKKKKRKFASIYGNYKAYYGYRIGRDMDEDPRLSAFKREWFEGKECLDIGCNEGLITISIARIFLCRSILGIDIDGSLIKNADWNLKRIAKMELAKCQSTKASESELTMKDCGGKISSFSGEELADLSNDSSRPSEVNLSERVSFRKENIVESLHTSPGQYDTILCLSVTKWVHLNWGDDGLITLFTKIWRLLRPGGILILEPQPWKSYKTNHLVSEIARANFSTILLKPNQFHEILLDKIGFRKVENVSSNLKGSVAGFNRPIFIFYK